MIIKSPQFIDTHCHLNMMIDYQTTTRPLAPHELDQIELLVSQAKASGVSRLVTIGTGVQDSKNAIMLAQKFPDVCAVIGVHPCDSTKEWERECVEIQDLLVDKKKYKIIGIGETGLDFYHVPFDAIIQEQAFRAHIKLALTHDLPLVLHVRQAADDVLRVMREYIPDGIKGVFHCFLQSEEFLQTILEWGFYVGVAAPLTYPKNQWLRELMTSVPLDRLVFETDAPFLPPQQYRGHPNKPGYITTYAGLLAELKNVSYDQIAQHTSENAARLFKYPFFS